MRAVRLSTDDASAWDAAIGALPGADVHFSAAYHRACERDGRGRALLLVAQQGGQTVAHPVLLRNVESVGSEACDRDWLDAESVYGYTGPLATADPDPEFLEAGWDAIAAGLREEGVVAEFVRLHPYARNERLLPRSYSVLDVRKSITLPLEGRDSDELWNGYPSVQRNMVRRARASGVVGREVAVDEQSLDEFARLYEQTMRRLGASADYSFSSGYFQELRVGLGGSAHLFAADDRAGPLVMGLFLAGPSVLHYHLGASETDRRVPGQANSMLHAAAEWARAAGLQALHLGGGTTGEESDSLYRFKRGISRDSLPVRVATCVHDPSAYRFLCDAWLTQAGVERAPDFHLVYRLPLPA